MEKALKIIKGRETLVSATDIRDEYRGRIPYGVKFVCPMCRQPLFPAAMSYKGVQSPHFRHEKNNPRAKQCELFASSYGYYSTYQRVPMPMFIRPGQGKESLFVVEIGLKPLSDGDLQHLVACGARLHVCQKTYKITRDRFSEGIAKFPLEELALSFDSTVRLSGTDRSLGAFWGYPEDGERALVFSRDPVTNRGRRYKLGDGIPIGSELFILGHDSVINGLNGCFKTRETLGIAGTRKGNKFLRVAAVTLADNEYLPRSREFLDGCGFGVSNEDKTPSLIWPPSVCSSGEILPIFERTRAIFKAPTAFCEERRVFIHSRTDSERYASSSALKVSDNPAWGLTSFPMMSGLSFVSCKNDVFSSAMLLHPTGDFEKNLQQLKVCYELADTENEISISSCSPIKLKVRDSGSDEGFSLSKPSDQISVAKRPGRKISILQRCHSIKGEREIASIDASCPGVIEKQHSEVKASRFLYMSKGMAFAAKRLKSMKNNPFESADKLRAAARKAQIW